MKKKNTLNFLNPKALFQLKPLILFGLDLSKSGIWYSEKEDLSSPPMKMASPVPTPQANTKS